MRWPFRRRPAGGGASAVPPAEVTPAPAAVRRAGDGAAGRRNWQALPPLTPVVRRPYTTLVPGPPDVSGTRSLLHHPARPTAAERPAGVVSGLACPLPPLDLGPAPSTVDPAPAPARRVTAVDRPAPRPSLLHATPDHVGTAREPAQPHRAPGWLRALSNAPVMDPLLGMVSAAPPPPPAARRPAPATRTVPPLRPGPGADRPPRPRRGVGLGAPMPDERDTADGDPEPAALAPPVPLTHPAPGDSTPVAEHPPAAPDPGSARFTSAPPGVPPAAPVTPAPVTPAPVTPAPGTPASVAAPVEAAPAEVHVDRVVAPPHALTREIATTYGTDLDGVMVHRGPTVDRRARNLQAAAYATDDAVHLPSTAGRIDSIDARALIAHELVHLAQQRHLGAALPEETSTGGAHLEAVALAVEAAVRSGGPLPSLAQPQQDLQPVVSATYPSVSPGRPARDGGHAHDPAPASGVTSTGTRSVGAGHDHVHTSVARPLTTSASPMPAAVRGRIQRRATATLAHPRPVAPVAAPVATSDPVTPAVPAATGSATTRTPEPAPTGTYSGQPRSFAEFGQMVSDSASELIFDAWSMDDPRGGGSGGGSAGGGSHDSYEELAGARLDTLNQERLANHQAPLDELPYEEQRSIRQLVDNQGGGSGGGSSTSGGSHGRQQEPQIRSWDELGEAARNDYVDLVGSPFGLDSSALFGDDSAASAGNPNASSSTDGGAAAGRGDDHAGDATRPLAESGRPAIDTDDLDLDELVLRIYDRIRSRLRLELLLDRERAGLLSDFR
jgi:hypothetical protein